MEEVWGEYIEEMSFLISRAVWRAYNRCRYIKSNSRFTQLIRVDKCHSSRINLLLFCPMHIRRIMGTPIGSVEIGVTS